MVEQVTLRPGDLLCIPRGQYHDALASQNGAIHVAFGLALKSIRFDNKSLAKIYSK